MKVKSKYEKLLSQGYERVNIGEKYRIVLKKGGERIYFDLRGDREITRFYVEYVWY